MRTLSWMAIVITVALALQVVTQSNPSQIGRDIASAHLSRIEELQESTLAIRPPDVRRLRTLSNALEEQGLGPQSASLPRLAHPRAVE